MDTQKNAYKTIERLLPQYKALELGLGSILRFFDHNGGTELSLPKILENSVQDKSENDPIRMQVRLLNDLLKLHGADKLDLKAFDQLDDVWSSWKKSGFINAETVLNIFQKLGNFSDLLDTLKNEYDGYIHTEREHNILGMFNYASDMYKLVLALSVVPPQQRQKLRTDFITGSKPDFRK